MAIRNRESDVVKGCLEWLALKGVWSWRQNQGAIPLANGKGYRKFVGMKGVSDILGVITMFNDFAYGVILAVECKRPGEKLRPDQEEFLRNVNERGGVGICVSSIDELEKALMPYLGK